MNRMDQHLDELFNKARTQAPEASFMDTVAQFNSALAAIEGGAALAPWLLKLFSAIGGLTLTGALVITAIVIFDNNEPKGQSISKSVSDTTYLDIQSTSRTPAFPLTSLSPGEETTGRKITGSGGADPSGPADSVEQVAADVGNIDRRGDNPLLQKAKTAVPEIQSREIRGVEDRHASSTLPKKTPVALSDPMVPVTRMIPVPKRKATLFTLTELSSNADFQNIEKLAADAGVDFYSHVHRFKHRYRGQLLISDFVVKMTINGTGITSDINVDVPKRGKFEVSVGWFVDEGGKVVALTDDITITKATSKHPKR